VGPLGALQPAGDRRALPEGMNPEALPPPIGRHRYFHKLYALDTVLPELRKPTKPQLEKAMVGHVLAQAELIGTYKKARP
jgi:Phosphatidylethanolamine-binding protein